MSASSSIRWFEAGLRARVEARHRLRLKGFLIDKPQVVNGLQPLIYDPGELV